MSAISVTSRVIVLNRGVSHPNGTVIGIRMIEEGKPGLEYEVRIDNAETHWFDANSIKSEDGKRIKKIKLKNKLTVSKLIKKLGKSAKEYQKIVDDADAIGTDSLNLEETEDYGVYKGKAEVLEMVIDKLKTIKRI